MGAVTDLHDLALEYLDACVAALDLTPEGAPARRVVSTGEPAWDCCPQLAVYIGPPAQADTLPGSPPLAPGLRIQKWGNVNLVTLLAAPTRCVPTITDDGSLPSPAAITAAAEQTDADIWALWNYIPAAIRAGTLFASTTGSTREVFVDGAVAQNAQGGCAGWVFQVRVRLDGFAPSVST